MRYTSRHFSLLLIAFFAVFLLAACSSSTTWEDAQEADTHEAYRAYMEDNPEGEHLEEARKRADNRYWNDIQDDTTAAAFERYLAIFPDGAFRSQAQTKLNQILSKTSATKGRVTGSNVIIRSDHTTESPSAGVVAKEGTVVQILSQYNSANSNEAILKRDITVMSDGKRIRLSGGKAIRIVTDLGDSVQASFTTPDYGGAQATISKDDIEAIGGERWYQIHTRDDITGWIYGKFIEEL